MVSPPKPRPARKRICLARSIASCGWVPNFSPHLAGPFQLGLTQCGHRLGHSFRSQPLGLQLLLDTCSAQFSGTSVEHGTDHPLFVDEVFGGQRIQCLGQGSGLLFKALQLSLQLHARVLAGAEQAQRPGGKR